MLAEMTALGTLVISGFSVRTNNTDEVNQERSKIGPMVQAYFSEGKANQIKNRKYPGLTYIVYTKFDSDENGEYTCLIGEEVTEESEGTECVEIPASNYRKFTTQTGPLPKVVIDQWQEIWKMGNFDNTRTYVADFEVYDQRAMDPTQATVDIFIGVK